MRKAVIAQPIQALLEPGSTVLDRSDITVFPAATNDEVLAIHRAKRVDLIMTRLDLPGMAAGQLFHAIREDPDLRAVSAILACANTQEAIEESSRCRVNAVLLDPLHPVVLMVKAQQLLNIAARESLRVLLGITVDGRFGKEAFYCRSKNISASGILIETRRRLAEGERLSCQFSLSGGAKVQAGGKVIRIMEHAPGADGRQYGLMFTDVEPEVRKLLTDFVEKKRAERGRT
jgi:CheY-like chemotaxis protein